jgi:hypothetical protein
MIVVTLIDGESRQIDPQSIVETESGWCSGKERKTDIKFQNGEIWPVLESVQEIFDRIQKSGVSPRIFPANAMWYW